jgi:hypothetical protein
LSHIKYHAGSCEFRREPSAVDSFLLNTLFWFTGVD